MDDYIKCSGRPAVTRQRSLEQWDEKNLQVFSKEVTIGTSIKRSLDASITHEKTSHRKALFAFNTLFLKLVANLKESPFDSLKTLGKTLYQWREEVVRMCWFTKNNGIREGFHRKMKLIQRRTYGFRNFENYRLRVKVLCS